MASWTAAEPGTSAGMSLRVKSHTDLQAAGTSSLGGGLHQALSTSSGSLSRGSRFGSASTAAIGEVKGQLVGRSRRPVRVVRPVSTNSSFLHINNLQGELVRKRKVRKKENSWKLQNLCIFFFCLFFFLNCRAPRAGRTGHLVPLVSVFGPSLTFITECCCKVETDTFPLPAPPNRKTGGAAVTSARSLSASPAGQTGQNRTLQARAGPGAEPGFYRTAN